MTDSSERETTVCPHCDSTQILPVNGKYDAVDHNWRCDGCGARFDEPAEREVRGNEAGRFATAPHARAALEADPDAVPDGGRVMGGDEDGV